MPHGLILNNLLTQSPSVPGSAGRPLDGQNHHQGQPPDEQGRHQLSHGIHHAHDKNSASRAQPTAFRPSLMLTITDHTPHPTALEPFRAGGDQRPDLRRLVVPGGQGGVQVVHSPVSTSDFNHLDSAKKYRGWRRHPLVLLLDCLTLVLRSPHGAYLRPFFPAAPGWI